MRELSKALEAIAKVFEAKGIQLSMYLDEFGPQPVGKWGEPIQKSSEELLTSILKEKKESEPIVVEKTVVCPVTTSNESVRGVIVMEEFNSELYIPAMFKVMCDNAILVLEKTMEIKKIARENEQPRKNQEALFTTYFNMINQFLGEMGKKVYAVMRVDLEKQSAIVMNPNDEENRYSTIKISEYDQFLESYIQKYVESQYRNEVRKHLSYNAILYNYDVQNAVKKVPVKASIDGRTTWITITIMITSFDEGKPREVYYAIRDAQSDMDNRAKIFKADDMEKRQNAIISLLGEKYRCAFTMNIEKRNFEQWKIKFIETPKEVELPEEISYKKLVERFIFQFAYPSDIKDIYKYFNGYSVRKALSERGVHRIQIRRRGKDRFYWSEWRMIKIPNDPDMVLVREDDITEQIEAKRNQEIVTKLRPDSRLAIVLDMDNGNSVIIKHTDGGLEKQYFEEWKSTLDYLLSKVVPVRDSKYTYRGLAIEKIKEEVKAHGEYPYRMRGFIQDEGILWLEWNAKELVQTDENLVLINVVNVEKEVENAKKIRQMRKTLEKVGETYEGIFYIDMQKRTFLSIKNSESHGTVELGTNYYVEIYNTISTKEQQAEYKNFASQENIKKIFTKEGGKRQMDVQRLVDGTLLWERINIIPGEISSVGPTSIIVTIKNIDEEKLAEGEKLKTLEAQLRGQNIIAALSQSLDFVIYHDIKAKKTIRLKLSENGSKVRLKELNPKVEAELIQKWIHPEYVEHVMDMLQIDYLYKLSLNGTEGEEYTFKAENSKTGKTTWMRLKLSIQKAEDQIVSAVYGYTNITKEITSNEQKRLGLLLQPYLRDEYSDVFTLNLITKEFTIFREEENFACQKTNRSDFKEYVATVFGGARAVDRANRLESEPEWLIENVCKKGVQQQFTMAMPNGDYRTIMIIPYIPSNSREYSVIYAIKDTTQDMERILKANRNEEIIRLLRNEFYDIMIIDLNNGEIENYNYVEEFKIHAGATSKVDKIEEFLANGLSRQNMDYCKGFYNIEFLKQALFLQGERVEYTVVTKSGRWLKTVFMPYQEDIHKCSIAYTLDITAEAERRKELEKNIRLLQTRMDFGNILEAMSSYYNAFYAINLKTYRIRTIKGPDYMERVFASHHGNGMEAFEEYLTKRVDQAFLPKLKETRDSFAKGIPPNSKAECTYRTTIGNYIKASIYRLAEENEEGILMFENADAQEQTRQELEMAVDSARAANNAKSLFLSNMSHDLRTPMNAIMGMTNIVKTRLKDVSKTETGQEVGQYINKIEVSSQYLLNIINNILDMSRLESGKMTIAEEKFSVKEFVGGIESIIAPQASMGGIEFQIKAESIEHENLIGDMTRISQVLINILGNSIKFTESGGKIGVAILEQPSRAEGYTTLVLICEDTGCGISEEFMPKLFNTFEQERRQNFEAYKGTGLGMAIVKSLVELMDGQIFVKSKLNVGTRFTIEIPIMVDAGRSMTADAYNLKDSVVFREKRFLIAEDININAEVVLTNITMRGGLAEVAEDGIAAVDLFSSKPEGYFDYILMDIRMPRLNGYEAIREIRRLDDRKGASIPIIAMSADTTEADKLMAREAGANGYIDKPIKIKDLEKAVVKCTSRN